MKKLVTFIIILSILATSSLSCASSGLFEYTYTNKKFNKHPIQANKITCFKQDVAAANGPGHFKGVVIDARASVYKEPDWVIQVYLKDYKGVASYSVKGGSQFEQSIMHFTGGSQRYFSSDSKPGTIEITSDDGNTIKGNFNAIVYRAGMVDDNPQTFQGSFTISLK